MKRSELSLSIGWITCLCFHGDVSICCPPTGAGGTEEDGGVEGAGGRVLSVG